MSFAGTSEALLRTMLMRGKEMSEQTQKTHSSVDVTDATFEETVLRSPLPVVVDFWAPWCGPCRYIAPLVEKLASEFSGRLVIAKVNVDENSQRFVELGLRSVPSLLFFHCGEQVGFERGSRSYPELRALVAEFIARAEETPCQLAEDDEERAFAAAVAEADAAYETTIAPAYQEYELAVEPHQAIYVSTQADADGRLERHEISKDEHDLIVSEATELFKTNTLEARARFKSVLVPAETQRNTAIEAARAVLEASRRQLAVA